MYLYLELIHKIIQLYSIYHGKQIFNRNLYYTLNNNNSAVPYSGQHCVYSILCTVHDPKQVTFRRVFHLQTPVKMPAHHRCSAPV